MSQTFPGFQQTFEISQPPGNRVAKLEYQGKPLGLDEEYDVVLNNYRAGGGGNFTMFKGKPVIKDIQVDMTELLADFFQEHRRITAACNDNWKVIPTPRTIG